MFHTSFTDSYKHKGLRNNLVKILIEKGITDTKVLDAIGKIPRHFFLDNAFDTHAYQDKAFQIGEGQTISQPYTVAFQTQLLEIKKGETVLEIGTGSGYQTCVLLELGAKVFTVERIASLHTQAKNQLNLMGYKPHFFLGDGTLGLETFAPFDKIIVTAGAPEIPKNYLNQLKINGKLVIPVGNEEKQMMFRIVKTSENDFSKENHGDFKFVKLKGSNGW